MKNEAAQKLLEMLHHDVIRKDVVGIGDDGRALALQLAMQLEKVCGHQFTLEDGNIVKLTESDVNRIGEKVANANKINAVKEIRELCKCNLRDAVDIANYCHARVI